MTGESSYRCSQFLITEPGVRRDRMMTGNNTTVLLSDFDPALFPADFGIVARRLAADGYALVNNPNPEDRLHLRVSPDQASESRGKYYNGTPVYVRQDLGEWVQASVAGVEGHMMKRYLAFGMDMLGVEAAFPQLCIRESLAGKDVDVYLHPRQSGGTAGTLADSGAGRERIIIIGIAGDWYHVICGNDLAGYMPVSDF